MKVESISQYAATTVVFEDSDEIYLRLVGSGDGLMPIWYMLNQGAFDWVEDSHELDLAWVHRNRGI